MAKPRSTAPVADPVSTAAQALEAARAALAEAQAGLETEQAKLGTARGTLADLERQLETLADEMTADPGEDYRQRYALRVEDLERQKGVVRTLGRRCEAGEAEVARLEAEQADELARLEAEIDRQAADLRLRV